jgi:hypothetical protein
MRPDHRRRRIVSGGASFTSVRPQNAKTHATSEPFGELNPMTVLRGKDLGCAMTTHELRRRIQEVPRRHSQNQE